MIRGDLRPYLAGSPSGGPTGVHTFIATTLDHFLRVGFGWKISVLGKCNWCKLQLRRKFDPTTPPKIIMASSLEVFGKTVKVEVFSYSL